MADDPEFKGWIDHPHTEAIFLKPLERILITDTGERWRADEQNNFQKVKAAAIAPTEDSSIVIIEDADNQAIWLGQIPDEEGADVRLHAVKGGSDSPSDHIRTAAQKLVERNR